MDKIQIAKGEVWAYLEDVKTGVKKEAFHKNNIIVDVASNLLAELVRGIMPTTCSGGIPVPNGTRPQVDGARVLAIGTGAPGWNLQSPPPATAAQTLLENEIDRNQFDRVDYINGIGNVTVTRTNVLELETTFGTSEANGALVEMGLFGGTNALNANMGTQINALNFPVINKTSSSTLTILWRLTF